MYKFPIAIPSNLSLILAQPFKADTQIDFSQALSKTTTSHNGVDVICGDPQTTWGKECVWPFPWPGTIYDSQVDAPFGATQHAHAQIDTMDPDTGINYSLVYIHLSAVTNQKSPPGQDNRVITYNQGDVIGRIGNNGFVNPPPTPEQPYNGTHLHLGLGVKKPGEFNFSMVDPLLYFDLNDPFRTTATQFKFNQNLWFGMKNNDVIELQGRLSVYPQSGFFGPLTVAAVIKYQKDHGITPAVGFVGPITRSSLNK